MRWLQFWAVALAAVAIYAEQARKLYDGDGGRGDTFQAITIDDPKFGDSNAYPGGPAFEANTRPEVQGPLWPAVFRPADEFPSDVPKFVRGSGPEKQAENRRADEFGQMVAGIVPGKAAAILEAVAAQSAPAAPIATAKPEEYALDLKVEGPAERRIQAGRPVRLRAVVKVTRTGSAAVTTVSPFDDAPTAYRWALANPPDGYNLEEWTDSDGRSVVFADPKPGQYEFVLAVSRWVGGDRPLLETVRYTLISEGPGGPAPAPGGGTKPAPGPTPPAPTPAPGPSEPAPTEFAVAVADAVRRLVPEESRPLGAKLAEQYKAGAQRLASGEWKVADAKTKQRALNDEVLGDDRPKWAELSAWLAGQLKALDTAGALANEKSVAIKWAEISLGLALGAK